MEECPLLHVLTCVLLLLCVLTLEYGAWMMMINEFMNIQWRLHYFFVLRWWFGGIPSVGLDQHFGGSLEKCLKKD